MHLNIFLEGVRKFHPTLKGFFGTKEFKNLWTRRNVTSESHNLNSTSVTIYNLNFMSSNTTAYNDNYFTFINPTSSLVLK